MYKKLINNPSNSWDKSNMSGRKYHQFALIMILFILISLAYSMIIPVFNAPDESFHFEYIQFLAKNKNLPNQMVEEQSISTEGFNPPLYYFIKAIFLNLLSKNKASDIKVHKYADFVRFYNHPYEGFRSEIYPPLNTQYIKWGLGKDKNMFLTTEEDRFPFSGSIRVIHLLRIISIVFGALTIFFIFKTVKIIFPHNETIALLAACLCAFNPQFNFISGSLNNDNLVVLFATLSIWLVTGLIFSEEGGQSKIIIFLGIFISLGLITKVNLSGIILIAVISIIYKSTKFDASGLQRVKKLAADLILFSGPVVCITSWYFIRNLHIYGLKDPLGWRLLAARNPSLALPAQYKVIYFKKVFFHRLFTSFWGQFDWLTISLPNWAYWIYGLISLAGILGLVNFFIGKNHSKKIKICTILYLIAILMSVMNLIILNLTFLSAQARLIFPTIACICIFIAAGINFALKYPTRWIRIKTPILFYSFITLMVGLDLYALFWIIYPVYR